MATITKWYLHDAATSDTGTLPSVTFMGIPDITVSGAATARSMDGTAGVSQASVSFADLAYAGAQDIWVRTFVSAPLAAQTIASQNITERCALQNSNTDGNIAIFGGLYVWRPSSGAIVGTLFSSQNGASIGATTSETDTSFVVTAANVTAVGVSDGDILVYELWVRPIHGAAVSYTDHVMYDGTTDGSGSSNAAYVLFTNPVTMLATPPAGLSGTIAAVSGMSGTLAGGTSGVVATFGPSGTPAQLLALMADMTIDEIALTSGTYPAFSLTANIDRTARPLSIHPAPGATVIFSGAGLGGGGGGGSAGGGTILNFPSTSSSSAFVAALGNMSIDTINVGSDLAPGATCRFMNWADVAINIDRTARPLRIQPAPGVHVIWDGGFQQGNSSDGVFYVGWASKTAHMTFDAVGTGGSFGLENYCIGQTGIISTAWVEDFTMNGFRVRGCSEVPGQNGWTAHTVYVSSDGTHRAQRLTFNDWDTVAGTPGPGGSWMNNFQMEHAPQADTVNVLRWHVVGPCRFGAVTRLGGTGVLIDGWVAQNLISPLDNTDCTGIVRNFTAISCTNHTMGSFTDGGNNNWNATSLPASLPGVGAFQFGLGGVARHISLDSITFTGYNLGQTGIIWCGNAHDMSFTNITVIGNTGGPAAWALDLTGDAGAGVSNIIANNWTVTGSGRNISGAQLLASPGASSVQLRHWIVAHLGYAYFQSSPTTTGVAIDDWAITDTGVTTSALTSVHFDSGAGTYSNVVLDGISGRIDNVSGGTMVDAGGNGAGTRQAAALAGTIAAVSNMAGGLTLVAPNGAALAGTIAAVSAMSGALTVINYVAGIVTVADSSDYVVSLSDSIA